MAVSKLHVASLVLVALSALSSDSATAQKNDLAARPPMGWNSWNHFRDKVDDTSVRAQAEAMVSSGMRDAGYTYINIDDTWEGERDANGNIQTNSKFPDMKALADFVHSKGLKSASAFKSGNLLLVWILPLASRSPSHVSSMLM